MGAESSMRKSISEVLGDAVVLSMGEAFTVYVKQCAGMFCAVFGCLVDEQ